MITLTLNRHAGVTLVELLKSRGQFPFTWGRLVDNNPEERVMLDLSPSQINLIRTWLDEHSEIFGDAGRVRRMLGTETTQNT